MKMMQQKDQLLPHTTSYDSFLMNNHAKLKNFLQNKLPRDFMFENPPLSVKDDPFGRKVLGKFRFGTQCNTPVPIFNKKGTPIFVELNAPL